MNKTLDSFLAAIAQPGSLQDALKAAGQNATDARVSEIASAHGFPLTEAELASYAASLPLADDALEQVAAAGIPQGSASFKVGQVTFAPKVFNHNSLAAKIPSVNIDIDPITRGLGARTRRHDLPAATRGHGHRGLGQAFCAALRLL